MALLGLDFCELIVNDDLKALKCRWVNHKLPTHISLNKGLGVIYHLDEIRRF